MATIVPMTPQVQQGGRSGLQGAVGRGLADMLTQFNEQKRQQAFTTAIQGAIKNSKNRNEFVGSLAPHARTPAEVQKLYELAEKVHPDQEGVEMVMSEGLDPNTGLTRKFRHPKGKPPNAQELMQGHGLVYDQQLREKPVQFYKGGDPTKPIGRPSGFRPKGGLTLAEGKANRERVQAGPAGRALKESEMNVIADLRVHKEKITPQNKARVRTHLEQFPAIRKQIDNQFTESFGPDFASFGSKGKQAQRAHELAKDMHRADPTDSGIVGKAVAQAIEEFPLKDIGASIQEPVKEEGGIFDAVGSFLGGGEAPAGEIPADFQLPAELEGASERQKAAHIFQQFPNATVEQVKAWLKSR